MNRPEVHKRRVADCRPVHVGVRQQAVVQEAPTRRFVLFDHQRMYRCDDHLERTVRLLSGAGR